MKFFLPCIFPLLALLSATVAIGQGATTPATGTEQAPSAEQKIVSDVMRQVKGKTLMLKGDKLVKQDGKLTNKYTILYFTRSGCAPCRMGAPHNVKAYHELVANNPDIEVVLCSVDRFMSMAEKWAKDTRMPWPILPMPEVPKVPLAVAVQPGLIPMMILVDEKGKKLAEGGKIEEVIKAIK